MDGSIQNILELPKDALTLVAGHLELYSLNRFARSCKTFSSILHYDTLWEILYYRQPWILFAPKKEKIPSRKPNTTWKSTFIEFKNLVFEKFAVPVRGFNWAINAGVLPPKKDVWIQFLIANRGQLLSDDQIAEIMFKSIKSKESLAKIFFEEINVDLPLDLLLIKIALIIRPIPNTSPELAIEAIAYEYTRRILKPSSPEETADYQAKIRSALLLILNAERKPKSIPARIGQLTKEEFDAQMASFISCPELQRGSDKFFDNISSLSIHSTRTKMFRGRLTWIGKSGIAEIVYCEVDKGVFTAFRDEKTKEKPLKMIKFEEHGVSEFNLELKVTKETEEMIFEFDSEIWTTTSLKDGDNKDFAHDAYNGLYYNIVIPKLLPW